VRIRGVDRRPARTGCRPRSALRWIRSLSCAGTLSTGPRNTAAIGGVETGCDHRVDEVYG
jgi:hypothetical protein